MNLQETINKIEESHADNLLRARKAIEIGNKIEPHLPEEWTAEYIDTWRGLLFCRMNSNKSLNKMEFSGVCGLVQQATGKKVKRAPWIEGDFLVCLQGTCHVEYKENETMSIQIRQYDTQNCKLEYEEKMIKQVKIVGGCLGVVAGEKEQV